LIIANGSVTGIVVITVERKLRCGMATTLNKLYDFMHYYEDLITEEHIRQISCTSSLGGGQRWLRDVSQNARHGGISFSR